MILEVRLQQVGKSNCTYWVEAIGHSAKIKYRVKTKVQNISEHNTILVF